MRFVAFQSGQARRQRARMKRVAILAVGFSSLLAAAASALVYEGNINSANQNPGVISEGSFSAGANNIKSSETTWSDANGSPEQKAGSTSQLKGNPDQAKLPDQAGGLTRDFSVSEPVELSSGPAPKEAPVPRAGWIALAGVLGVMAARWFSAARRSRIKSAAD